MLLTLVESASGSAARSAATIVLSAVPLDEAQKFAAHYDAVVGALRAANLQFQTVGSIYDHYDYDPQVQALRDVTGELIVLGWHYPRAIKWTLARQHIEVNGATRKLHCIDVREMKPDAVSALLKDILVGKANAIVEKLPDATGTGQHASELTSKQRGEVAEKELASPENAALSPRWYPVIDYDQCTNCMECMDFCLFGVYGVDHAATLRVSQQDQCRQDCPACSRVCPVGAIIFPKYQTNQTIAGARGGGDRGEVKLDLSSIFGKPKGRHQAALERDRELIKAGRKPAGAETVEKLADAFDKMEL
jgi:NAD-dependent dihydropyrimidine dehydrogenase PreA subunit